MSEPSPAVRARRLPRRPPVALRPYVSSMIGYDFQLPGAGSHRGLPTTSLTLVLPVLEPLEVGWHRGARDHYWACLSGLGSRPAEIHHRGRMTGVQLALAPAAARRLLGLPAGELSGVLVELHQVVPALSDLPERLAEAGGWSERLRLVETTLLGLLAGTAGSAPRTEMDRAMAQLAGPVRVAEVADRVGLSRRRLAALFRAELGLTPKEYQRIARFERSHRVLGQRVRAGRPPSLAGVAAACGYADQAHLTREWSALAGYPPAAWLRAEFPYVQDTPTRGS